MRASVFCLLYSVFCLVAPLCFGAETAAGTWVNVTNNVGGETWGYAGVCLLAAVPGSDEVIAGVSERGLWSSTDGGATWKQLGTSGEALKQRPHKIVFDPRDPAVYWVSGCYGPTPFMTADGGKSFKRLGNLNHADGIAVDFSEPERKTMLLGLHEQARSLQLSKDGGKTWQKIGDKLPENSNHSTDPIILDSRTFLINTAGWKQGATLGIYRSEDGGETWSQVSTFGPGGRPLVASDGQIYWQRIWGGGLLRSADKGKTWSQLAGCPVKNNVIELPDKRLAGNTDNQVFVSADAGATWTKLGPALPFKASGIACSAKSKVLYAWRLTDKKDVQAIVRLNAE
jgi:photosystem II stability/assembly factor-like uncharacterized protein